jgi:urease accessory protein
MPGHRPAMSMTAESDATVGLYRLLAWLSPGFPIGAFSYSHGLEAAAAAGAIRDRASLEGWIAAIVVHGSGRIDAEILCAAYRASTNGDTAALAVINRRGIAYRATAELALESGQQGAAFRATHEAAWFAPHPDPLPTCGERECAGACVTPRPVYGEREGPIAERWEGGGPWGGGVSVGFAAVFGVAAAGAGIGLHDALVGYLQAFTANLVSAGLRLGIVGQTDGQRILAALEPRVFRAAEAAMSRGAEQFGSATFMADLMSMAHETQYSRLFRS